MYILAVGCKGGVGRRTQTSWTLKEGLQQSDKNFLASLPPCSFQTNFKCSSLAGTNWLLDHVHLVAKATQRQSNPSTGKTVESGLAVVLPNHSRGFFRKSFFWVVELNKTNQLCEVSRPS